MKSFILKRINAILLSDTPKLTIEEFETSKFSPGNILLGVGWSNIFIFNGLQLLHRILLESRYNIRDNNINIDLIGTKPKIDIKSVIKQTLALFQWLAHEGFFLLWIYTINLALLPIKSTMTSVVYIYAIKFFTVFETYIWLGWLIGFMRF